MTKRHSIEFVEANKPIRELVTKFGGQPVWINESQWPHSRSSGRPMHFICQIALEPELFGPIEARMAYLFMTDSVDDEEYVDGTWEPDGGENAVILQPGRTTFPTQPLERGPTLYRRVKRMFRKFLVAEPGEFAVKTILSDDPPFVPQERRFERSDEENEQCAETLAGNKIGGTPDFVQSDEYPDANPWNLLLQLDSAQVPFSINFGDAGIGYAFLSSDGQTAKFLWQCA
jgi:Domain of unknown function (DUF1963)